MQIVRDNLHEMSKVNLAIPRKVHNHKTQPPQGPGKGMDDLKHIIKQTSPKTERTNEVELQQKYCLGVINSTMGI